MTINELTFQQAFWGGKIHDHRFMTPWWPSHSKFLVEGLDFPRLLVYIRKLLHILQELGIISFLELDLWGKQLRVYCSMNQLSGKTLSLVFIWTHFIWCLPSHTVHALKQRLTDMDTFVKKDKLKWNPDKTEVMLVGKAEDISIWKVPWWIRVVYLLQHPCSHSGQSVALEGQIRNIDGMRLSLADSF